MNAIEARGLGQRFGSHLALRELDLDVEVGESVAVLGDNGSGKTTLLRLLATAARPATGTLTVLGLDTSRDREALRGRIGYLGHHGGLYPALTALENLEFFCSLFALPRPRAREVLELVGLGSAQRRRAAELSRGMQQRLALGRAVLHRPELLLLDEPDAALDQAGRALLAELGRGRTLVLATHDRGLAESLCSRTLLLAGGRAHIQSIKFSDQLAQ